MPWRDRLLLVGTALAALAALAVAFFAVGCAEVPTEPTLAAAKGSFTLDTVLVRPAKDTVLVGEPVAFCAFDRYVDGRVALSFYATPVCRDLYAQWFTTLERAVSAKQQRTTDITPTDWSVVLDIQS
jgi:hypothetical protein